MTYAEWIANWLTKNEAYGNCWLATLAMKNTFPELRRVRGHYLCAAWGEREHWWLVAEDGSIVDPTASQFPTGGFGDYVPWDESQPEPTGKCMNCGEYCFDNVCFCCAGCEREVRLDMGV